VDFSKYSPWANFWRLKLSIRRFIRTVVFLYCPTLAVETRIRILSHRFWCGSLRLALVERIDCRSSMPSLPGKGDVLTERYPPPRAHAPIFLPVHRALRRFCALCHHRILISVTSGLRSRFVYADDSMCRPLQPRSS